MPRQARPRWHKGTGRWYARIGPPGRDGKATEVYAPRGLGPRDEAKAWEWFQAEQARQVRYVPADGAILVSHVFVSFLAALDERVKAGEVTREQWRNVRSHLELVASWRVGSGAAFGDRVASSLTADHLAECIRGLPAYMRVDYAPTYLRHIARSAIQAMRWAARQTAERPALLSVNPFEGYRPPAVPRSPERYAERRIAAAFLWFWHRVYLSRPGCSGKTREYDRMTLLMERILVHSGARPKELCRAKWSDVKWDARETPEGHRYAILVLPPDRWKSGRTTGRERLVYLTPVLTRALRRLRGRALSHPEWIFVHGRGRGGAGRGEPWADGSAVSKVVRKVRLMQDAHRRDLAARLEAGEELSRRDRGLGDLALVELPLVGPKRVVNYQWRHTAASDLLNMGVAAAKVAELLGTSVQMLQHHYGHILARHLDEAAEALRRRKG